jgi:predicted nucleic acid-binding protein
MLTCAGHKRRRMGRRMANPKTTVAEDLQHGQVIEGMRVENPFL